jgi:hypothetical protein
MLSDNGSICTNPALRLKSTKEAKGCFYPEHPNNITLFWQKYVDVEITELTVAPLVSAAWAS